MGRLGWTATCDLHLVEGASVMFTDASVNITEGVSVQTDGISDAH